MVKDFSKVPAILTINNVALNEEVKLKVDKSEYLAVLVSRLNELGISYEVTEIHHLTPEQEEALNNIQIECEDNLKITYDDTVLDIDFELNGDNLIVINNIDGLRFRIRNNELEAIY